MENAVEALKIAFGVALFVIALTLSISCFSNANTAVSSIIKLRDRDIQYEHIQPAEGLTRIVGVETIVPTMYTAYNENIEIYFLDENDKPLPIYYKTDSNGNKIKDDKGDYEIVNYVDLAKENFGNDGNKLATQVAKEHLDMILGVGKDNYLMYWYNANYANSYYDQAILKKYEKQLYDNYRKGFYDFLNDNKFEESLGEYYQGDESTSIKKRVITYKLQK